MKNKLFFITIAHHLQRKVIDSAPISNKPGASKGDSTCDDRLQRKIQGLDGATDSDYEMMHAQIKHSTHKSQVSDEASQAEEATAGGATQQAQHQHTSGRAASLKMTAKMFQLPGCEQAALPPQVINGSMRPNKATAIGQVFHQPCFRDRQASNTRRRDDMRKMRCG